MTTHADSVSTLGTPPDRVESPATGGHVEHTVRLVWQAREGMSGLAYPPDTFIYAQNRDDAEFSANAMLNEEARLVRGPVLVGVFIATGGEWVPFPPVADVQVCC